MVHVCILDPPSHMSSVANSEASINAFVRVTTIRRDLGYTVANTAISTRSFTLVLRALHRGVSTSNSVPSKRACHLSRPNDERAWWHIQWEGRSYDDPPLIWRQQVLYCRERLRILSIVTLRLNIIDSPLRSLRPPPPSSTPPATLLKRFSLPLHQMRSSGTHYSVNDVVRGVMTTVTEVLARDEATIWFCNPHVTSEWKLQIANTYELTNTGAL
ncbi:hypothetical protein EDD17DRAFT_96495 [Pisolithus thermaeus]|nr:hypothetical protein EDD17DRAFT_96495 [Pisolithus thermaeus]